MSRYRAVVVLAGLALLAGCAPDTGTVTDRKVESRRYAGPEFLIQVTDPNARHPVYTDRRNYGWVSVSEDEYFRYRIGAAWPDCKRGKK